MADTPPIASSPAASTPPSSAAEQARLRKERREAKIKAGGSARLNRITGLGGGFQREIPPPPAPAADPSAPLEASPHFYKPSTTPRPSDISSGASSPSPSPAPSSTSAPFGPPRPPQPTQSQQPNAFTSSSDAQAAQAAQLRQLMLGLDPNGRNGTPSPSGTPGAEQGPNPAEDPMIAMLQQMMGGLPGGASGFPGFPPQTGVGQASGQPGQQAQQAPESPYAYVWRIVHAIFALSLGLYVALTSTFSGSKIERELGPASTEGLSATPLVNLFYIFATAEVVLQSSRFFLEKGTEQPPAGILGMVSGFLPEPYKTYVGHVIRYGRIWTRVSEDACVCLFVLGVAAWWRS